jgi:hypothetical protein
MATKRIVLESNFERANKYGSHGNILFRIFPGFHANHIFNCTASIDPALLIQFQYPGLLTYCLVLLAGAHSLSTFNFEWLAEPCAWWGYRGVCVCLSTEIAINTSMRQT